MNQTAKYNQLMDILKYRSLIESIAEQLYDDNMDAEQIFLQTHNELKNSVPVHITNECLVNFINERYEVEEGFWDTFKDISGGVGRAVGGGAVGVAKVAADTAVQARKNVQSNMRATRKSEISKTNSDIAQYKTRISDLSTSIKRYNTLVKLLSKEGYGDYLKYVANAYDEMKKEYIDLTNKLRDSSAKLVKLKK